MMTEEDIAALQAIGERRSKLVYIRERISSAQDLVNVCIYALSSNDSDIDTILNVLQDHLLQQLHLADKELQTL
jgi:Mg2+ and Co2+ transporter CorA